MCMVYQKGVYSGNSCVDSKIYDFTNNGTIVLELNMNDRALFIWVNGVLVLFTITNIPIGVYFGVLIFKLYKIIKYYLFLIDFLLRRCYC
jgi:hypothetical protein